MHLVIGNLYYMIIMDVLPSSVFIYLVLTAKLDTTRIALKLVLFGHFQ